ncbi:unnamed protein product, partial [Mesorhabditis belari]|uniref:F-actin-capping protein subunit beta n=1 Tax=Mesorhabditis belari TaxID=2138241 RepID=A0AAF3F2W3_9BILA
MTFDFCSTKDLHGQTSTTLHLPMGTCQRISCERSRLRRMPLLRHIVILEQDCPVTESNTHLVNIEPMIEEQESKMRHTLNEIYFGKTKQVLGDLRTIESAIELKNRENSMQEIKSVSSETISSAKVNTWSTASNF